MPFRQALTGTLRARIGFVLHGRSLASTRWGPGLEWWNAGIGLVFWIMLLAQCDKHAGVRRRDCPESSEGCSSRMIPTLDLSASHDSLFSSMDIIQTCVFGVK